MIRLALIVPLAATAAALVAVPATGKGIYVATMWGRSGHATVPQAGRVVPLIACAPARSAPRRAAFYTIVFSIASGTSVHRVAVLYAPSVNAVAGNRAVPGLGWRRTSPALARRLRSATETLRPYRTPRAWPPGMKSPPLDELLPC
jgi:hypothetical protein